MSKILISILFILMTCLSAFTQKGSTLSGRIIDEQGQPLISAHLSVMFPWGDQYLSGQTDLNGSFKFTDIENGGYKLVIKYTGYEPITRDILVNKEHLNLGEMTMSPSSKNLSEIVVKETRSPGLLLNDTIQFSSGSFKLSKDASAEDLIEKMPTISKDNGQIKSHNEDIKQILVDGKPFFGNDPNLSLKNLPAEIIDKVQIFDQQSDQSQFTGINDGNTVKTINIVTKQGLNNGQFGKIYLGYGTEKSYQTGGNLNYFDGDRRISLIGMSNNINIQNFSVDDILSATGGSSGRGRSQGSRGGPRRDFRSGSGPGDFLVPQSGGIATTHAIGLNYTDRFSDKLELNVSYFMNTSETDIESEIARNYFADQNISQFYSSNTDSNPKNTNHRINSRLEYKIDSSNSILIRPRISFQNNNNSIFDSSQNNTDSITTSKNKTHLLSDASGLNFSNNILFRHRFKKQGRTASIDFGYNMAPGESDIIQESYLDTYLGNNWLLDTIQQEEYNDKQNKNWNGNFEFTEAINKQHSLSINYRYESENSNTEITTYDIPSEFPFMPEIIPSLSSTYDTRKSSNRIGVGHQLNVERKLFISTRLYWERSQLNNLYHYPTEESINKVFSNVFPSLYLRYSVERTRSLSLHYRSSSRLPQIDELQQVINNSNPSLLTIGNPDLNQALQHSASIRFNTNFSNSSMLFASVRFNMTDNYVANHIFINSRNHPVFSKYDIPENSQLTIPENTSSSYQLSNFLSYSIPVVLLKSNLSIDASYIFNQTPTLIDDSKFNSTNSLLSLGLNLSSNISEFIDFNLQFRPSYNSYSNENSEGNYFIYNSAVKFNWQFLKRIVLRTSFNYTYNQYLENDNNQQELFLLNAAIGCKVFKNERGEFALGVNDLFNQNNNLSRTINDAYIEDQRTNNLQRFFMLSFTYHIRNFNTGKKASIEENTEDGPGSFNRNRRF